jgi:beta-barrel assembly-enhancing protease
MQHGVEFDGGVLSQTIEGGRAGARLSVRSDGVHARTSDGQTFHLPYASCRVELGGASGKMWFCRSPDRSLTLFSEAKGFADALRSEARRELGGTIDAICLASRISARRTASLWLAAFAAVALLGGGAYYGLRHAGSAAIDVVPRSVDEKLGELASEHAPMEGQVLEDPVVTDAVRQIVDRLADQQADATKAGPAAKAPTSGGFTFRVRVVDAPIVNAYALPGGFVVVYTGLLRAAATPEQLAGVLAHEMAHVTLRHGMRRIAQSLGVVATVQLMFGDVSGVAAIVVELLREGALSSYSRDQEHEADRTGVRTLIDHGVDPQGLADFFTLLARREPSLPSAVRWLGSHPDLGDRIRAIEAEAKARGPKTRVPFQLDWAAVQQHADTLARRPSDTK